MKKLTASWRARVTTAGILALVLSGIAGAPVQAATGGPLDPANRLGDITLSPTSGKFDATNIPNKLTTTAGCPEGYRGSSRVLFFWADGTPATQFPALIKLTAAAGNGLDGLPMDRAGTSAARWGSTSFGAAQFKDGIATYVVTCDTGEADSIYPGMGTPAAYLVGDAKYFSTQISIQTNPALPENGTWELVTGPVEKVDTTTTLTPTAGNDGSVTLTAAVDPAAATGDVTFTDLGTGAVVGTDALEGGAATVTVDDLEPDTQYRFRAQYAGDDLRNPSTSNEAVVTTVGEPMPPQQEQTEVTVTIPGTAASDLRFTVTPGGVALGEAELDGTEFVATGELGNVTVTDNREPRNGWTLNGQASAFTKTGDTGTTIPASALGWSPQLVGGPGQAGQSVAPGVGLAQPKALASAQAGATTAESTVKAGLTLRAPQDTPEGAYSSTLTLTLI